MRPGHGTKERQHVLVELFPSSVVGVRNMHTVFGGWEEQDIVAPKVFSVCVVDEGRIYAYSTTPPTPNLEVLQRIKLILVPLMPPTIQ